MNKAQVIEHWNTIRPNQTIPIIPIAYKHEGSTYAQKYDHEADAHLIAAAPDMYEALKLFLSIEYPPDISEWLGEKFPETHESAQQALAKAEGKND